jgi:multidrug efflux pump subunit AcrB
MFPKGVYKPIKTRSIDDVPMLGITLWSEMDDFQLRQIAEEVTSEIEKVKDVAITEEIGGRSRVLKVILDKDKMAENGIDPMGISQMIQANNSSSPSASFVNQDEEYLITTGKFLTSADDVENLVVGLNKNRPVYLRQVACSGWTFNSQSYVFWLWKTNDNYKSAI